MPASCLRQGRKGPNETTGADVRQRPAQARRFAAAPWREETAQALGRGTGAEGARAVIGTSARLRGRGRLLRERNQKGPGKTNGAHARQRSAQA